jgi:uncharacterized membrane protein YeaQ/YmgE (transglycosylase-associated protein family)
MKKNMGTLDQIARILVALGIVGAYYMHWISGTVAIVLLSFAAIFIITSFMRFCPLYLPFGISTHKKN